MRFIFFICFFIIFIVIANLIHKNMSSYQINNINNNFTYYNITGYNNNDIKSLVSLSFKTSFDTLANLFDVDKEKIKNNILKKNINIRKENAELIIFTGNNKIEQITINTSNNNIDVFLNDLLEDLNSNNIQFEKEILDDENGDELAEIYTHKKDNYKFIITKTCNKNNESLSIDYISLI